MGSIHRILFFSNCILMELNFWLDNCLFCHVQKDLNFVDLLTGGIEHENDFNDCFGRVICHGKLYC